jgi:toxin YoeB
MKLTFSTKVWEQYLYWQTTDKKILKRINLLIKDIQRTPNEGVEKPEPLKHGLSGYWSRRINDEHRIVYEQQYGSILTAQLRYHYGTLHLLK